MHYPIAQAGNWADCVRVKGPVIYNDFANSPDRQGLPPGHTPIKRFMSVPILANGKVAIVFGMGNKAQEYTDRDQPDSANCQRDDQDYRTASGGSVAGGKREEI